MRSFLEDLRQTSPSVNHDEARGQYFWMYHLNGLEPYDIELYVEGNEAAPSEQHLQMTAQILLQYQEVKRESLLKLADWFGVGDSSMFSLEDITVGSYIAENGHVVRDGLRIAYGKEDAPYSRYVILLDSGLRTNWGATIYFV